MGAFFFFLFLAAVIIVPQVLRYNERGRLHETLRMAFERGQPVPPDLIDALRYGRRNWNGAYYDPTFAQPSPQAGAWRAPPPVEPTSVDPLAPGAATVAPAPAASIYGAGPLAQRDLRRGLVWLSIGLGLIAAGAAFYAGLYDTGGAPETFSTFAAFGAIPVFVGLTYLGLWHFGRKGRT